MTATAPPLDDTRPPRWRWVAVGIWLVYLGDPASDLVQHADGWRRVLGIVALVLFVAIYMRTMMFGHGFREMPAAGDMLWHRWPPLLALLACSAALVPGVGDKALTCLVFVGAAAMSSFHPRLGFIWIAALVLVIEASGRFVQGWDDNGVGFALLLAGFAVFAAKMAFVRQRQLVAAERELGELALEEERSRIARDLHDILGHSLTVISVKTELAERMLDVDVERARSELHDLERLTRDALADVRSTALGVRGVSLPGEIAAARTALESAGIDAQLPTVADEVPSRWRELFAWTVREAVTNVIRHSRASTCRVTMSETNVTVTDDGVGSAGTVTSGHGLEGLRQRAKLAGATLAIGPGPGGSGFSVGVEVRP